MLQTQHLSTHSANDYLNTIPPTAPAQEAVHATSCMMYKLAHLYCGKEGAYSTQPRPHHQNLTLAYTTQRHQATARCTLCAEGGWAANTV